MTRRIFYNTLMEKVTNGYTIIRDGLHITNEDRESLVQAFLNDRPIEISDENKTITFW